MGDIWPYGPPRYVKWTDARGIIESEGISANLAAVFAAIGEAESSLDLTVINDTPSTGDYSVGIWQINYYNGLYAGRASAYGTPKQLIEGGIQRQAKAAIGIWHSQGFSAWSTYNSGAYKQFLHGAPNPSAGPGGGNPLPNPVIHPPTEDYSATVRGGAVSAHNLGIAFDNAATVLRRLKG